MSADNPTHFGTVTFGPEEEIKLTPPADPNRTLTVTRQRGEWRPPDRIANRVFDGFAVPIDCYRGSDGIRRIIPHCGFEGLIDFGAVGGLAVLHGIRDIDAQTDYSYRAMYLIHRYVRGRAYRKTRGMKNHLTRHFQCSRDLHIRKRGRLSHSEQSALPDRLGRTATGEGRDWSVSTVTARGRDAARESGHVNPSSEQAISFGLYEAARRNPLQIPSEEVPGLIRCALFQPDDSDELLRNEDGKVDQDMVDEVTRRLLKAIHKHLGDTDTKFDHWLFGASNSIIKQVAKQKKAPGGSLPVDLVRDVFLEVGWRAYGHVGQCVHLMMRTIKNALADLLEENEKRLYEHMHEAQPYYGHLPAAMLAERIRFLRPAVLAIWGEPDNQEHVRVLHRMLEYYAHMAFNRREADRRAKGRLVLPLSSVSDGDMEPQDGSDDEGGPGKTPRRRHQLLEVFHVPQNSAEKEAFGIAAEYIRLVEKLECNKGCSEWEYHLQDHTDGRLVIHMQCECGEIDQSVSVSHEEFAQIATEELGWRRTDLDPDESADS